jgi:hypothetical protein
MIRFQVLLIVLLRNLLPVAIHCILSTAKYLCVNWTAHPKSTDLSEIRPCKSPSSFLLSPELLSLLDLAVAPCKVWVAIAKVGSLASSSLFCGSASRLDHIHHTWAHHSPIFFFAYCFHITFLQEQRRGKGRSILESASRSQFPSLFQCGRVQSKTFMHRRPVHPSNT